jgi:hypothetical protein
VSGASLALDDFDTWQLNLTTGEWSVEDEFIPQAGWTLLHVDREETEGEDGAATNAFDDSASTFWYPEWSGAGHLCRCSWEPALRAWGRRRGGRCV